MDRDAYSPTGSRATAAVGKGLADVAGVENATGSATGVFEARTAGYCSTLSLGPSSSGTHDVEDVSKVRSFR